MMLADASNRFGPPEPEQEAQPEPRGRLRRALGRRSDWDELDLDDEADDEFAADWDVTNAWVIAMAFAMVIMTWNYQM